MASQSLILAIDTSSRRGSIALVWDGRVAALFGLETETPQSAALWENVDLLLARSGRGVTDVTAFAVARGPGSFTGLRVGMAAAAGFAHATGRPLYGATSLELTARFGGAAPEVWAVLNAYRNEVYAQPFSVHANGRVEAVEEPVVCAPAALFDRFDAAPRRILGDGADAYAALLEARARELDVAVHRTAVPAPLGDGWQHAPSPAFLAGELGLYASAMASEGLEPGAVEPCYVRPSEAEINLKLGRLGQSGRNTVREGV